MKICICGGGNLGHVCAGFLANRGHQVSILTTKPELWSQTIEIVAPEGAFEGQLAQITSNAADAIPQAEIVLICLPGFAIQSDRISPIHARWERWYRALDSSSKPLKCYQQTFPFSDSSGCRLSPGPSNMDERPN